MHKRDVSKAIKALESIREDDPQEDVVMDDDQLLKEKQILMVYRRNPRNEEQQADIFNEMNLSPADNNVTKFSLVAEKVIDSSTMIFMNFININSAESSQNELLMTTSNGLYIVRDSLGFEHLDIEVNAQLDFDPSLMIVSNILVLPTDSGDANALLTIDRFGQPSLPASSGPLTYITKLDMTSLQISNCVALEKDYDLINLNLLKSNNQTLYFFDAITQ